MNRAERRRWARKKDAAAGVEAGSRGAKQLTGKRERGEHTPFREDGCAICGEPHAAMIVVAGGWLLCMRHCGKLEAGTRVVVHPDYEPIDRNPDGSIRTMRVRLRGPVLH
jgi:hypothetical protein